MSLFRPGRQHLGWRSLLIDARLLVAILRHPELWYVASTTAIGLIPRAWWRRAPFLPVPDARWMGFRLETAYGSERAIPSEADFLDFLRWCQMMRKIAQECREFLDHSHYSRKQCLQVPISYALGPEMIGRALVLNASYEPLCVVSSRRALILFLDDKAEVVHSTGFEFHSERAALPEPSVVRLLHFVKVPRQTRIAITRRSVFARDGHRCQYCGAPAENIDHVIPRSRGGAHAWDNVVASCKRCNTKKEDHLLEETAFTLRRAPRVPRSGVWLLAASGDLRDDWQPYVAPALMTAV